jgi:hypothetical protein
MDSLLMYFYHSIYDHRFILFEEGMLELLINICSYLHSLVLINCFIEEGVFIGDFRFLQINEVTYFKALYIKVGTVPYQS